MVKKRMAGHQGYCKQFLVPIETYCVDFVGLRPCPPITCSVRYVLSLAAGAQKFGEVYKSQFLPELGQYFPFYSVTLKQKLKETQDKVQHVH